MLKILEPLNEIHRYAGVVSWRTDNRSSFSEITVTGRNIKFIGENKTHIQSDFEVLNQLYIGKVQIILTEAPVRMKMISNHWKKSKVKVRFGFISKYYRNVTRSSKPKIKKNIMCWRLHALTKQCYSFSYCIVFWYIWDSKEHKGKWKLLIILDTVMHMQQNSCISSLFFMLLYTGQNADHAAFYAEQYCVTDKIHFYLLKFLAVAALKK